MMATTKQRTAARKNVRKAQAAWQSMSHRQHARAQPQGRAREEPGKGGAGEFNRIRVRPKDEFVTFRTQKLGGADEVRRVAGKRQSGSWDTQAFLISKEAAHVSGGKLVPDTEGVKGVLEKLGSTPRHVEADVFEAKPRRDIPEREKPTPAQQRARGANIKKAQAARRART
jgi:hypothetical protein